MVRLEAEVKQIAHAIRMAACNAETLLARGLDGHYARAGDEAYALIREALTASGDICPGNGQLLIRLARSPRPGGPRHSPSSAASSTRPRPATRAPISSCVTRSNPILALHEIPLYVRSPVVRLLHCPAGRRLAEPLNARPLTLGGCGPEGNPAGSPGIGPDGKP